MNAPVDAALLKEHLIDPEICIRCNTCEATCPVDAISHDSRNYAVDPNKCNFCMDCISPCPTGSIDNWRLVPKTKPYSVEEQLTWDELPAELTEAELSEAGVALDAVAESQQADAAAVAVTEPTAAATLATSVELASTTSRFSATTPPWSAAHPYSNLYGPRASEPSITATVSGNFRVTSLGSQYDTHHIVLDFGNLPFPVLEGQSIAIVPPGTDGSGRAHHPRQYSIASPRNGERPGYNNISLTIKRVLEDYTGKPVRGVASNYLCDLKVGDQVQVIGPFGTSFLMPNHPKSHLVMICTGTGSAPMRAMTEWRRRLRKSGKFESGKLLLFFGARTRAELPYFGPLQSLPRDFIDVNFAFSRTPGQPKQYVQDLMRERSAELAKMLNDDNAYFYVCGLRTMEEGVLLALRDIATTAGLDWSEIGSAMRKQGRLHLETY